VEALTDPLADGARLRVLGCDFGVLTIPGHTLDHIAYFSTNALAGPVLFCGDTLFAGGCGRVFEGTFEMMHASLQRLDALPAETLVYCAHEYTAANLRFAHAVEPGNPVLAERILAVSRARANGEPTVPTTLAAERATNPFLRCSVAQVAAALPGAGEPEPLTAAECFAGLRRWKDRFQG
jgi:hydroxyacylglutathione hydrolase